MDQTVLIFILVAFILMLMAFILGMFAARKM